MGGGIDLKKQFRHFQLLCQPCFLHINCGTRKQQLGNLEEHLQVAREDIRRTITDPNFDGLGIIDWEKWRPIWDFNWGKMRVYKKRTMELMKKRHPSWPWKLVDSASRNEWEETTKQWMLKTLELTQEMRPKGKWCYYHLPDCYNYVGKDKPEQFLCSSLVRRHNDRLIWLWNATGSLCPSIYYDERQMKYNETQQIWFLHGRLSEVLRVSQPDTPIYPYINYRIHSSLAVVSKEHFWLMLAHLASLGLDGAVIWGSSNYLKTEDECRSLQQYVDEVIAPASSTISSNANHCGEAVCNGNGICTWPRHPYSSWKYLVVPNSTAFEVTDITCRCQAYRGRYCNVRDSNLTDVI
uniref:Hyaluronidase n=1 Tax=Megacormus gertschi TaxID=1843536 RepID=A0A224XEV3_9SCOR